jgi:hypothetical protein
MKEATMFSLKNDQLNVTILDPVADRSRLGGRYCAGGYIYQVEDARLGALISGPGYPAEEPPPVFDGQGLPESFRRRLTPAEGDVEMAIGVGLVDKPPVGSADIRAGMAVREFSPWMVAQKPDAVVMTTMQRIASWMLILTREVSLHYRTVRSETWLQNMGMEGIPVQWFPHPFFPWPAGGEVVKFSVPVSFPENPGYELCPSGFIARKTDHEWNRAGHFQLLDMAPGRRGRRSSTWAAERHPTLGMVTAAWDYPTAWMPIWGNVNTFSFEPYYETTVAGGQTARWSISYDF